MPERRVRRFRTGLMLVGGAWRLFLIWPLRHVDSTVLSLAIGLAPYALLTALAPRIVSRAVLWITGLLVFGIDVASSSAAMTTASSTGAVAGLLAPLVSAAVVVPLAMAVDLALKRKRA